MTKKTSTPMNPPEGNRRGGLSTTSTTATARRPSMSGRKLELPCDGGRIAPNPVASG